MCGCVDAWMQGDMDRISDGCIDCMGASTCGFVEVWMSGCMQICIGGWMIEGWIVWMHQRVDVWVHGYLDA